MSMSMNHPSSSDLNSSFQDHPGLGSSKAVSSQSLDNNSETEDSSPATLMNHPLSMNSPGSASAMATPPPFRSTNQSQYNRQYSPPNNFPTSVSAPSFPSALAMASSEENFQNGEPNSRLYRSSQSKIESLKNWSISTYKCTKQMMFEKLGKTSRTVDSELESRIEHLREIKRRYSQVLELSRAFTRHFYHVIQTQMKLAEVFSDLAQKSPELQQEFLFNAETQRNLHKNGEILLNALNFFLSSVNTLCNKTIEDTILTIRQYENARIEYDAYRSELELMLQIPKSENSAAKIEEAQRNFNIYKLSYEKLRDDVNVKLQFLDENRIKVMHKQLLLFHNAISAYFSGNQQALESTLKQFSISRTQISSGAPSWLEQQ